METTLYDLVSVGPDSLVFKDAEETYEYSRYQEKHHEVDITLEEASEEDFKI